MSVCVWGVCVCVCVCVCVHTCVSVCVWGVITAVFLYSLSKLTGELTCIRSPAVWQKADSIQASDIRFDTLEKERIFGNTFYEARIYQTL